jgi:hypothetical protein
MLIDLWLQKGEIRLEYLTVSFIIRQYDPILFHRYHRNEIFSVNIWDYKCKINKVTFVNTNVITFV